jgi:hypothetical protein
MAYVYNHRLQEDTIMFNHLLRRSMVASFLVFSAFLMACAGNPPSQNSNTPTKPKAAGPPLLEGILDITDCDMIHGWAWDQNNPDGALNIEIYDGTTLLATVKADELRNDLIKAGKGTGKYAFTYTPSPALRDRKPHTIHVKIAGSDYELGNSPKTITCSF